MKKIVFLLVGLYMGFFASQVLAADVSLVWVASNGDVSGYKISMSTDKGVTWGSSLDVGNVTQAVISDVANDKLILFRVSSYNSKGETVLFKSGAWYDGTQGPPSAPNQLGINVK